MVYLLLHKVKAVINDAVEKRFFFLVKNNCLFLLKAWSIR